MSERIIGYTLLVIGIAIIAFTAYNVFSVFTSRNQPIQPFEFEGISLNFGNMLIGDATPEEAQQIRQENPDLNAQLVAPEMLNKPLNLFAHLILMGFISSVGFKIASIGVMLVRPIKVDVKPDGKVVSK